MIRIITDSAADLTAAELTAPGVTDSSSAVREKLRCRDALSKARRALRGKSGRTMRV